MAMIDEIKQHRKKKKIFFSKESQNEQALFTNILLVFSVDGSVCFLVYKIAHFEVYRVGLDLIVRTRQNRMRNFWSALPAGYDVRYRRAEIFFNGCQDRQLEDRWC